MYQYVLLRIARQVSTKASEIIPAPQIVLLVSISQFPLRVCRDTRGGLVISSNQYQNASQIPERVITVHRISQASDQPT